MRRVENLKKVGRVSGERMPDSMIASWEVPAARIAVRPGGRPGELRRRLDRE
jgi:hypothetical protein